MLGLKQRPATEGATEGAGGAGMVAKEQGFLLLQLELEHVLPLV